MHILITGSSGQIGTNLALRLLAEGHEVLGVDIRANTWTDRIPAGEMDLTQPCSVQLAEMLKATKSDVLVHLAAHAKVHELVRNPSRALENVVMHFQALEAARLAEVPLVVGSSREVYGDIHRHVTDESCADFVIAESPYSAGKIAAEAFTYSYEECYGLPYLVFRFSNVYGRYDNDLDRMERVVPLFIDRISKRLPIVVYGAEKVLDFTYIDDCVEGIARGIDALASGRVKNETVNLACGVGNSLETLAGLIAGVLDVDPEIEFRPTNPGEVTRYVADIAKARELLGYIPRTPLEEGIAKAIAWASESASQPAK